MDVVGDTMSIGRQLGGVSVACSMREVGEVASERSSVVESSDERAWAGLV